MVAGIVIGSIFIFILLVILIYKLSNSLNEANRKNITKQAFDNKNYKIFFENIRAYDLDNVITKKEYIIYLSDSNISLKDKINKLKGMYLLSLPENGNSSSWSYVKFKMDDVVPMFFLNEAKNYINNKSASEIYVFKCVIDIIKSFYKEELKPQYSKMDDAYEIINKYIKDNNIEPNDYEIIQLNNEALELLNMKTSYNSSQQRKLIDDYSRNLRIESENGLKKDKERLSKLISENEDKRQKYKEEYDNLVKRLKLEFDNRVRDLDFEKNELIEKQDFADKARKEYEDYIAFAKNKISSYVKEYSDIIDCLKSSSNIKIFPYISGLISDLETIEIKKAADALDWGHDKARERKVASLLELRAETRKQLEEAKVAYYQLQYLLNIFPALKDFLDEEYNDIKMDLSTFNYEEYDHVRDYLSKEEWLRLTETERNQLALDRYIESHSKNNWQIGRDYELYIGHKYIDMGYNVDFTGSYMGLEDMGRDLICKKDDEILIIQCKYWSKEKIIHENHINQLFGTTVSYSIEKNIDRSKIKAIFITNTKLSPTATEFAKRLNIVVMEEEKMKEFPRIKCNIGVDEYGFKTKIYHLPMDINYDTTKINKAGEFFAKTVKEAEEAGFRRTYKWHGNAD